VQLNRVLGLQRAFMKRKVSQIEYSRVREEMLPLLRDRVFHVSCCSTIESMLADGGILSNELGKLGMAFGSSAHSYFRFRGCVSLFDFRNLSDEELLHALDACSPWSAARACNYQLALWFLSPKAYFGLESGRDWNPKVAPGQIVVSFVEVGHPGRISLRSISELWEVTFQHEAGLFDLRSLGAGVR
jgi:hypothetical protein